MEIQYIENVISQGESSVLELKKSTGQLERGMESVCAFFEREWRSCGTILLKIKWR